MMTETELVAKLIDAGRILEAEGLRDFTRGHVSVRTMSEPTHFYMKPHGYGFGEITPENVVTCDLAGQKVDGTGRRHSEVFIHSEIFSLRPDIRSIVHFHAPYAVAFAATGQEMEPLSQAGAMFAGCLPTFSETMDLIRGPEQGRAVAEKLGPHNAVLLRGHGVVVAGATIEEAVISSLMLESACMVQLLVKAAGTSAPLPEASDVTEFKKKVTQQEQWDVNFQYLRRKWA